MARDLVTSSYGERLSDLKYNVVISRLAVKYLKYYVILLDYFSRFMARDLVASS